MASFEIKIWKLAPFIRFVLLLAFGILCQYYFPINKYLAICIIICTGIMIFFIEFSSIAVKYKYRKIQGVLIFLLFSFLGIWLSLNKNINNNKLWYANAYNDSSLLLIKIAEPIIEKENSFKTTASVVQVNNNGIEKNVIGDILIYFSKKDSSIVLPNFGDFVLIHAGLQKIKNGGNPGGFNYKRYMSFQQIHHQVFLNNNDFIITKYHSSNFLNNFIYSARAKVINTLKSNIQGDNKIIGIAEALLIGYKEDLDKDLVQAYSNTGVVHIIAISGMHLGLIYIVLVWIFARLPFIKRNKVIQLILILISLWLFSLITGASASVLRSAVMFTCILIGQTFFTRASIYNSLATSAFILLCYNPYMLWDVGFQLSYTAVIGIVWLQKPIENLYYSKYWLIRNIWKMCSITVAAQILTLPLCIYYFHQIPLMFLFTNLVCVPLSTIILFLEILLIIIAPIKTLALIVGKIIHFFTIIMNTIITFFNDLPFSLIDAIHSNFLSTLFLYLFVFILCASLLQKNKFQFKLSLYFLLLFSSVWAFGKIEYLNQHKIIVYNVSKHKAVDFISNKKYSFYGDDELLIDGALQNFNLKPSRVLLQIVNSNGKIKATGNTVLKFKNKRVLFIETKISNQKFNNPIKVDAVLISKNARLSIENILINFMPSIIIIDGSNSLWKITQWKKQCEELNLPYFITSEKGAFILDAT